MEKKATKVWLFDENYDIDKSVTYTIKSSNGGEFRWETKLTIVDPNGVEMEVDGSKVLYLPNEDIKDTESRIFHYLMDNDLGYTEVFTKGAVIGILIEWGDWKHEHIWCNNLMEYIGFVLFNEVLTEEDGSDCYSAEHYYYKTK